MGDPSEFPSLPVSQPKKGNVQKPRKGGAPATGAWAKQAGKKKPSGIEIVINPPNKNKNKKKR